MVCCACWLIGVFVEVAVTVEAVAPGLDKVVAVAVAVDELAVWPRLDKPVADDLAVCPEPDSSVSSVNTPRAAACSNSSVVGSGPMFAVESVSIPSLSSLLSLL